MIKNKLLKNKGLQNEFDKEDYNSGAEVADTNDRRWDDEDEAVPSRNFGDDDRM